MKNSGSHCTTRYLSAIAAAGVRSNIFDATRHLARKRGVRRIRLLITRGPGPGSSDMPAMAATAQEGSPRPTGDRRARACTTARSAFWSLAFRPLSRADADQGGRPPPAHCSPSLATTLGARRLVLLRPRSCCCRSEGSGSRRWRVPCGRSSGSRRSVMFRLAGPWPASGPHLAVAGSSNPSRRGRR
jgi:hypothetical protein